MKLKKYLWILISVIYMDIVFNLFMYDNYQVSSIINILLFDLVNALFIYILTSIWNKKANRIITYVIYGFNFFWYSLYYVFYQVFLSPFSLALLRQADQPFKFGGNIIIAIGQNFHLLILFFIPTFLLIIFRKKFNFERLNIKEVIYGSLVFLVFIGCYILNIFVQDKGIGSIYNLYFENNNVSLNISKLGIPAATCIDIYRAIFGINEKIYLVDKTQNNDSDYNIKNINFDKGTNDIEKINSYMKNDSGTEKNEYTGILKGKNLIYIVAESFSEIGVSKELTPTIYKLVHNGLYFENFYTSNNISTIGGEFQALTGLYADNTILTPWRGGKNYYPYGLGNVFKNLGYDVFAYHDHDAYFQDRNVYLRSQGFDNYKACGTGLEKIINCEMFPKSDIEMFMGTINDYINSEKSFMAYYMTVSGHLHYKFSENDIAKKNKNMVDQLDYPEEVKGYLATQIELDRALEYLILELEKNNKLDDTVIVMVADHYPYDLSIDNINKLSTYKRDSLIEANSNNLIIYNSKINGKTISKVGMSIDVIPTVYNLFGIDYDSRLIMGKDILSTNEGIAIFKDKSWVTNKGTYHASTGKFVSNDSSVDNDYVNMINETVSNRLAISRMIVDNNYYKYLFDNQ